ncbi:dihydroneopterin aldolase [Pseudomonas sp. SDO5522_S412]
MSDVTSGLARIEINNLSMRGYIGVLEDEMRYKQDLRISLTLMYDAIEAMENNDVDAAVDYEKVVDALMPHVENERFALLERLAQELLGKVMEFQRIVYARIKVERLLALRFTDSVSVTLTSRRSTNPRVYNKNDGISGSIALVENESNHGKTRSNPGPASLAG